MDVESQEKRKLSEEQYRLMTDNMSDIILLITTNGQIKYISPSVKRVLGFDETEIKTTILSEMIFPDDLQTIREWFNKIIDTKTEQKVEYRSQHKEKGWVYLETVGAPILSEDHKIKDIVLVARDITEKKKTLNQIELNNQRFKSLYKYNANSVYSFDLDGNFTSCNSVCEELVGYTKEELINSMNFRAFIVPEKLNETVDFFENCKNGVPQNFRTSVIRKDGAIFQLNVTIVPIFVKGLINGVFGISQDITKQVETEIANEHMAYHDYLTGLPNRNKLNVSLLNELAIAEEKKQNLAVLYMDLDRFKVINDTLGPIIGDQLLKEVAVRIKSLLDDKELIFRPGGDEFIVILKEADRDVVSKVCRRIQDVLAAPFKIQTYDIFTTSSIGISLFPEDGDTVETLIKHADFAMYQAKKEGKNNYRCFTLNNLESNINPLKLELDLHKAIQHGEFCLLYQPKVSLKTGKIVGVETLIQWEHPALGIITPQTFIPIAEETGLIIPIGEWVIKSACKQNKEWQQKGIFTTISVNLSAKQFTQSNFYETVSKILLETNLEPQYLELEITEGMTVNIERTISTLQNLKKLGIGISIDDYGTGFSSLIHLQKFPLDTLKIDQSFIRSLQNNPNNEMIVKTMISMAHNLNLNVVAVGIETKEELLFLQQHLCDEGQGHFFSKPISAIELENTFNEVQKVVQDSGLSQDVNDRKWAEELVRMARNELKETIRLQQGMIFKYKKINGQFIHTLCDGELLYRTGLIPSLVVGKQLSEFLPKEMAEEKELYYQRAWNGEEHVTYEEEINGVYYLAALSPIKRGGEVVEVIGSCIDITDRKNAEKALLESENKYRLITENMTDLIAILDIEGKIVYASPSHDSILGYNPPTMVGKSSFNFIAPEDVPFVKDKYKYMFETKQPTKIEMQVIKNDGKMFLFECFGSPFICDDGKVDQFLIVGRDITERRKAEELLWNSKKLSLVGELAAGVAHEIRNPITSIRGFIQLFHEGFYKDEYYQIILSEFNRIEEILKEFLSVAKPQQIKLKKVNITNAIKDVETLLESEANLRNVQFLLQIEQELPFITCDENQIKQVLINICKNSIEAIDPYKKGIIKINISSESNDLIINVIDNGVGISEDRVKRLGEPFFSNKEKGTGLGLMLCFRIIREHNGTMIFNSKENEGTTVSIRLPLR